jgi:hypothetical protein
MHPALVAPLSIPQRYYVPHRVRESYQPRLEAMGLWVLPEAEEPAAELKSFAERQVKAKQSLSPQQFKKTFSRQKVARLTCTTKCLCLSVRRSSSRHAWCLMYMSRFSRIALFAWETSNLSLHYLI